jgi:hypothetical protein
VREHGELHPPSQEATVSRPWRNAGVLRSLGEGRLELRRVTPYRRCHGLLPVGLHFLPLLGGGLEGVLEKSKETPP